MTDIVDYILMRDGRGEPISRKGFEDPFLENIRRAITDAEVIQAVGRARGVNRTADNPVRIFVFNDVVLPFAVDHLTTLREIAPDVVEKMLWRGAALLSPSDAFRVYPDLFCSEEAAKKALRRALGTRGQTPIITTYMDMSPPALLIEYQAPGARQKKRKALCMPDCVDWLRNKLEEAHGTLAYFEIVENPLLDNNRKDNDVVVESFVPSTAGLSQQIVADDKIAPKKQSETLIAANDDICDWLNARLASMSCERFRVEYKPAKVA
ncbi:MAG: hypothetical protein B7X09_01325 [Acidiphilium sp. 21-66-27]|nr:MAG: hypothetical protein B7X09_01325 [Acidiphilium sp. 21-66-27]